MSAKGTLPRLDLVIPAIINTMPEIVDAAKEIVFWEAPIHRGDLEDRERPPGTLRDSLRVHWQVTENGIQIEVYSEGDADVANYVIKGTAPHPIDAHPRSGAHGTQTAGYLRFRASSSGAIVFTQHVNHPGTKPNDFIGRAIEQIEELASERLVAAIDDVLAGQRR